MPRARMQLGFPLLQACEPIVKLFGGKVRAEREFPRTGDRRTDQIPHLERCSRRPQKQLVAPRHSHSTYGRASSARSRASAICSRSFSSNAGSWSGILSL